MNASLGLTLFIGGLALFLHGAQVLTDSFRKGFGGAKRALARLTAHRPGAFLFGVLLAGGTQSSSVATSLAVGLVDAGLLPFADALTAMMGASVGAMGVTFLLGPDWTFFSPLFLAACIAGMRLPEGKVRAVAENLLGLALLLTGMALLRAGIEPLSSGDLLREGLGSVAESHAEVFFLSAAVTAILQSGNAVVAVSIALGAAGLLPLDVIFPLVAGAHLGSSAPVLLVSLGTRRRNARRLAWANLFYRMAGAAAAWAAWTLLAGNTWLEGVTPAMAPPLVLGFVVSLNAVLFYPFAGFFAWLVERLPIRERESLSEPLYLDDAALALPPLALNLLAREMTRLASFADELVARILLAPEPKGRVEALRRDLPLLVESCLDFMFDIPAPPEDDPARTSYAGISYALIAMRGLVGVASTRLAPICLEGNCESLAAKLKEKNWENTVRHLVRLVGFALGSFVLADSDLSRRALDLGESYERDAKALRAKLLEGGGLFDSRSEVSAWEFLSAADDLVRAASEIARSESAGAFPG
jgi:phosphate:Na+ symporter